MSAIEGFSLSPQQKKQWRLAQKHGLPGLVALRISPKPDPEHIHRQVQALIARHEVLRTNYVTPPGMVLPLQVIAEKASFQWRVDSSDRSEESLILAWLSEQYALATHDLVVQLYLLQGDEGLLLLRLPAMAADGWSLALIAAQLGGSPVDAEDTAQYIQYSEWLADLASDADEGIAYWREQPLITPPDLPEMTQEAFRPRRLSFEIADLDACEALANPNETSAAHVFQTCWFILLARLVGSRRYTLATGLHARPFEELEDAFGSFSCFLPITLEANATKSVRQLLSELSSQIRSGEDWLDYSGFGPDQDLPLSPYAFEAEQLTRHHQNQHASITTLCRHHWGQPFALKLNPVQDEAGWRFHLYYDEGRISAALAHLLTMRFKALVTAISPQDRIGNLSLLSEQERQHLLHEFNATSLAFETQQTIHASFSRQARLTPEQTAIVFRDQRLSYGELNTRANQLAHCLRERGVRAETPVALAMRRSPDLIVAVMGILKAGGCYLPVDPDMPQERLAFVLQDSGARHLLTSQAMAPPEIDVIAMDEAKLPAFSDVEPAEWVSANHLAYIIYTSGSTGRPKGVQVCHHSPLNLWAGLKERVYGETSQPMLLSLNAPISFDAAMQQIIALTEGHCLNLIPEEIRTDPVAFKDWLNQNSLDGLDCTPAHLAALLEVGLLENNGPLPRKFLIAGGAIHQGMWDRLARVSGSDCYNIYGPTEATVDATGCRIEQAGHTPSIGGPLANYKIYLAEGLQPVPVGVPGEILIGGVGLARGYLARPALTATRFIPDPFASESGSRLYRSGDLARFQEKDRLVFLGRVDFQVKIRGNRVEIGEVEAAISRHEAVGSAVVTLHQDHRAEPMLVGYYTGHDAASPSLDPAVLSEWLATWLPAAYIPAVLVPLSSLPLTSNGKVDRSQLPDPSQLQTGQTHVPAGNATERRLAEIWEKVLGSKGIGIHDDFFLHGGHSLNGAILTQRITEVFGLTVRLHDLFAEPTIFAQADLIHKRLYESFGEEALRRAAALAGIACHDGLHALTRDQWSRLAEQLTSSHHLGARIMALPRDGQQKFPLSFAQQRLWFLDRIEGGSSVYNNPMAVRFHGSLDLDVLARCFSEIERRHEALRTCFPMDGEQPIQVFNAHRNFKLEPVDLRDLPDSERDNRLKQLIQADTQTPFNLETGPLWRVSVFQMAANEHVIAVTMHHICSDGWSMPIFERELTVLYDAFSRHEASPLPELTIQYADYAHWQRSWLQGEAQERELAYWQRQLANLPTKSPLPYDHPRPLNPSHRGASINLDLGMDRSQALRELSRRTDNTLYVTLLSCFYITLYSYDQQNDLVVGADVANRLQAETSDLIGFFINQLALRTNVIGAQPALDQLARTRETAFAAYEHQELPFDQVINSIGVDRSSGVPPLFQAKFFMDQGQKASEQNKDAQISHLDPDNQVARLDLTMGLWDQPGAPIAGWLNYAVELFLPETMARFSQRFLAICAQLADDPQQNVDGLVKKVLDEESARMEAARQELIAKSAQTFTRGKRRRVSSRPAQLLDMAPLLPDQALPLVISPKSSNVDLPGWLAGHRQSWESALHQHGAVLFRGFGIHSPQHFSPFVKAILKDIFTENAEHQVISDDGTIQVPVDYAADQELLWHSENSFNHRFPQKILFACALPAQQGGQTPLVDNRAVLRALPAEIVAEFKAKGIMYVRNYSQQLGLSWQQIFRTEDPRIAEQRCLAARMQFEWKGDQLKTKAIRPAILDHTVTGEACFIAQATHWHFSCLAEETRYAIASLYDEEDYPRNCYYGDGSRISDDVLALINKTYRAQEVVFPWQQGDAVIVDNILVAHARKPYQGPRKILVCMGDMTEFEQGSELDLVAPLMDGVVTHG